MTVHFFGLERGTIKSAGLTFNSKSIYMLRNDRAYFVINHNTTSLLDDGNILAVNDLTNQLANTNGNYCRLHGKYDSPFSLLENMGQHGYKFERDSRKLKVYTSVDGFTEIKGNLLQISSAFHYRFYDKSLTDEWLARAREVDPGCLTPSEAKRSPYADLVETP